MLADCVGTTEVLQYQRGVSHVWSVCFASPPHTCWLNCNASATVSLTPTNMQRETRDVPWYVPCPHHVGGEAGLPPEGLPGFDPSTDEVQYQHGGCLK